MADSLRGTLIDSIGRPINGAVVRVYNAGTGTLSNLYSDKALTVPITNDGATSPLTEADGSFGPYYVASARYDIKPVKGGYTFDDSDYADIEVEDVKEQAMTITAAHTFTGVVVHQGNESFTGQPGFNPGAAQAPFTLNANAQSQRVIGLTADKAWDAGAAAARNMSSTPAANTGVIAGADGFIAGGWGVARLERLNNNVYVTVKNSANPGAAFTVGPTGSGADIIISQMDGIATGARYLVASFRAIIASATASHTTEVFIRYNDASDYEYAGIAITQLVVGLARTAYNTGLIPLDGSRRFKIWYQGSDVSSTFSMVVGGYIK